MNPCHEVHVSGHASQEELKIIQGIVKPTIFHPGSTVNKSICVNMLNLRVSMGMNSANIYHWQPLEMLLELNQNYMKTASLPFLPEEFW